MMEWIRDQTAFARLREAWNGLYAKAQTTNVFLTHAWLAHWLDCFGYDRHWVAVCRGSQGLTAAMPFRREGDALSAIEDHTYLSQILYPRDGSPADLLAGLRHDGRAKVAIDGPGDERYAIELARAAAGSYLPIPQEPRVMRSIGVSETLGHYLQERPQKVRSELRRKLRRLERELPGTELLCLRRPDAERAWQHVASIELRSWKRDAGTAIVCSEHEEPFYRGLLHLGDAPFEARLYALVRAGEALAYVLGVVHADRFFALKTSYPAELHGLSPGLAMFCHLVDALGRERRVGCIELLGRDCRYKREIATHAHEVRTYELRARSLGAHAYVLAREHVRPIVRRVAVATLAYDELAGWLRRLADTIHQA